jgi:hypothetical protein
MVAAENPYKGQNFKMLISRLGADDPDLQQLYGGIQGRMRMSDRQVKHLMRLLSKH